MFPNQHEEERCGLLFWAVGLLEACHPTKHWTERGNRGKLSLPRGQSKQPGHMAGRFGLIKKISRIEKFERVGPSRGCSGRVC